MSGQFSAAAAAAAAATTVGVFWFMFKAIVCSFYGIVRRRSGYIQCVSVDSTSFVIYPELEATEVRFSALKRYLCSFCFRIDNETGRIQ